jgi:hypothetical protein
MPFSSIFAAASIALLSACAVVHVSPIETVDDELQKFKPPELFWALLLACMFGAGIIPAAFTFFGMC